MNAKRVFLVLLVLFFGFWMFQDPKGFAAVATSVGSGSWDALTVVFRGLIRFLGELV